jgi:hypothetical protein
MNQIEIYKTQEGQTQIEVQFEKDTVWLSQSQIAALFGTQRPAITKHLNNIFKGGELIEREVSSILEHTTAHGAIKGKTRESIRRGNGCWCNCCEKCNSSNSYY